MVTKDELLKASLFRRKPYKGILTTKEANEYIQEQKSLVIHSTIFQTPHDYYFFSDDHCFGVGIKEMEMFIPCSTRMPSTFVPRDKNPLGIARTAEEYVNIFNEGQKQITSIEELLALINGEDWNK